MTFEEFHKKQTTLPYFDELISKIDNEYTSSVCYPARPNIFRAFSFTNNLNDIKVVILGQDPYFNAGLATGLAFAVPRTAKRPHSLSVIFNELKRQYPDITLNDTTLEPWAKQGVLLMNTILSVRDKAANSHSKLGWHNYTYAVLNELNNANHPIVFIGWGTAAQNDITSTITDPRHLKLFCAHPASLRGGFKGNNHFIDCNEFLKANNMTPINWNLP